MFIKFPLDINQNICTSVKLSAISLVKSQLIILIILIKEWRRYVNQKWKSVEIAAHKLWVAPAISSSNVNHCCVRPACCSYDLTEIIENSSHYSTERVKHTNETMSGNVQPQGGYKLEIISFKRAWSFRKGSKRHFISYITRTECWNGTVIFFWHHFLSKLCFCQPFHMSSGSCHCLIASSSRSSISTSPCSICWASLLISFKLHLILLSVPMSVSHRLCLRSPGLRFFVSSCRVSHTLTWPRCKWAGNRNRGYSRWERWETLSEDHVLQGTDLCRWQALLCLDVLYQKCYIYITQGCVSENQMPLQDTSPSSTGTDLVNFSFFWLAFLSSPVGQLAEMLN